MTWSILLVDDSQLVRAQLRGPLEAKGVKVIEAEDGRQGLWRARENTVDLIIADIHMPIMDGISMVAELRKIPKYRDTPIFVLTSDAARTRAEEGKAAGANAWILKPVRPETIWKAIEKALFGRSRPSLTAPADDAGRKGA